MNKIAAVQMTSSHALVDNLALAASLIQAAAKQDAKVIVLPEMFPIIGFKPTDALIISEPLHKGPIQDFLSEQARKNKVWLVGGTIPLKSEEENKISAACLVFNDEGKMVAHYDKIHLFDVTISETESYTESATVKAGSNIVVVDTPCGKLGLAVCYDIRFPELFRRMANEGAEIFAIPAAFTVKTGKAHWEVLVRSRAIENFCYVVGACQTGIHNNARKTYGHSLIVNPWGEVIVTLAEGTGVITADIDLKKLQAIRKAIPALTHQKIN